MEQPNLIGRQQFLQAKPYLCLPFLFLPKAWCNCLPAVIIGILSVLLNTFLSIFFISSLKLPVWSLALSASIASLGNGLFLLIFLYRKVAGFSPRALILTPLKMFIASATTGVFLYVPMKLLDQLVFDTTRVFDLVLLTAGAMISGLSVYI